MLLLFPYRLPWYPSQSTSHRPYVPVMILYVTVSAGSEVFVVLVCVTFSLCLPQGSTHAVHRAGLIFFQMNPFYFLFWAWSRCLPPTGTVTEKRLLTFHQVRGMTRWGQASACQTYKDMGDKTCLCRDQPTLLLFHTVPTWNMSFALNGSVDRAVGKSLVWVAFIIWHLPHSVDTGSHYTQNKIKCKVFTSCCAIQSPQWMLAM